ncbi:MAG: WD40/YVTN/BNR-like repeat-containing protein [Bradymonadia bacterium]
MGPNGSRWLCEDAVEPGAGFRAVLPMGVEAKRWWVATDLGLFFTEDGGCNFSVAEGPLAGAIPHGISPRPETILRPEGAEFVVATATFGARNDVWWTEDGGQTWSSAGLDIEGRVYSLIRSPVDPNLMYVAHAEGAARSEDGGRTFLPMALGPSELEVLPVEFSLIGASAAERDRVYAVVQRFPTSLLLSSADGGDTWSVATELDEYPRGMATNEAGSVRVTVPFSGVLRQESPDAPWSLTPEEIPFLGCLTPGPAGDLWACSNVFFQGPWVLGSSSDFGDTWQPTLERFQSVTPTWGCAPESAATTACAAFCPGEGPEATCGDPDAGVPMEAQPDQGIFEEDSGVEGNRSSGGGCVARSGPLPHGIPWFLGCLAMLGLRLNRRSRGCA